MKSDFKELNLNELYNYIKKQSIPVCETQILNDYFPDEYHYIKENANLKAFKIHFILYHHLYKLQEKLLDTNERLYIDLIRIYLLQLPIKGKCRYLDKKSFEFCKASTINDSLYCSHHQEIIDRDFKDGTVNFADMSSYYLDKSNFYDMDELKWKGTCSFSNKIIFNHDELKKSYDILGLSSNDSIERVKTRYKYLVKKHHPDLNIDVNSSKKFVEIQNAYNTICNLNEHHN